MRKRILYSMVLLLVGLVLVTPLIINAQSSASYALEWSTIDGGGGISTGGAYSLNGTIGQTDAGDQSSGMFSLLSGYWDVASEAVTLLFKVYLPLVTSQ